MKHFLDQTPDWYRTPLIQTIALGFVFFLVFTAYTTIQFYAASTYGAELAANAVSVIYISFTISCLFAPSVVNKFGTRWSMSIGILGYALFVISSLIYFIYNDERKKLDSIVVISGGILGCGAALLWTGQGRLILEYATVAENQKHHGQREEGIFERVLNNVDTGTITGIFRAIFQSSALVGGVITFLYYSQNNTGSTNLYVLFLILILVGALSTQFLLPPNMLQSHHTQSSMEEIHLIGDSDNNEEINEFTSNQSWMMETVKTLKLFSTKPMLTLSAIFFYSGLSAPYQQVTFGNRFFTKRTLGIEIIIYNIMEIIGSIYCGRGLGVQSQSELEPRRRRKKAALFLTIFIVATTVGDALAFIEEYSSMKKDLIIVEPLDISDVDIIRPTVTFSCWGVADSILQVYCYWIIGTIYSSGDDQSRAVGFFKFVQSLGTSVGFFFIPISRMSALTQLSLTFFIFVVGILMSFFELPK